MPGLGASFGRGGATTAQQDLANADCILIQGSSMAEAHPVCFRWVEKAKANGAKVIHVDPRYSRTSALADVWVPIRAGTDIALLGGIVHAVLERELFFRDYVVHYTNASVILKETFQDTEDLDGYFSGWDDARRKYATDTWQYEGDDLGAPRRDLSLQHPRCVFQVLRRHFRRYTPELVERVAGVPPVLLQRVVDLLAAASGPERTAAICYAVGWTQHSKGVQIIRAAAILQLLLGNIGRPGGGILALRGHASIQGSTDVPTLYDILPGYMPMPRVGRDEASLAGWLRNHCHRTGWWHHLDRYLVSLLKAWYGARAHADNEFGYGFLPRLTGDHSHFSFFTAMADGEVEGLFVMGQNPAVGGQHSRLERKALARLRWLVVRDLVEIETASFWYQSPEIERGELTTRDIATEVFLLPAAGHTEKEGSFTNTQRLLQWREKAVTAPGDCRSEAWFVHQLALRLIAKAQASDDPRDEPLRALDWWYPHDEHGDPDMHAVLAEIHGYRTEPDPDAPGTLHGRHRDGRAHHGPQVDDYQDLAADGSTACGCWIYSGVYGKDGVNKALRRRAQGPYGHGWGFAWPSDRRILYNRASARPDGRPWSERKALLWWDEQEGRWTGHDVPDFPKDKRPDQPADPEGTGVDAHPGDAPFLMHDDGLGWIFAPKGLLDGPLPAHYEPLEGPVGNALYRRRTNPPVHWFVRDDNPFARPGDPRFPYVLTTYRLTEHHTAGGMSRFLPHLAELQPELFVELSPELALEQAITTGDRVCVATMRGAVEARALVTRRLRPLVVDGRRVHQVAMPFHWGSAGPLPGGAANDLVAISGEPNVAIHESKAMLCAIVPGPLPRGPAFLAWFERFGGGSQTIDAGPSERRDAARASESFGGGHGHEGKT